MKHRDLNPLDPLPADWTDAISEFISTAAPGFLLQIKPGNPTVLEVPAGVGDAQVGIGIDGRWRYNTATVERVSPGGVARTLDVFVTASDNNFVPGDPGEVDLTDYSFALAIVEHNATPTGVALHRLVATAVWNGTQFTALDVLVGPQSGTARHAATHAPDGSDPISLEGLGGASPALTDRAILDVGVSTQVRAGRQLTLADFTTLLGQGAPLGLWNLGDLTDISGGGRNLTNKGSVAFGRGITGATTEAAVFSGSTAQALYRTDTGGADPFRIPAGSWGCWFRTEKRGVFQALLSKYTLAQRGYYLQIVTSNVLSIGVNVGPAAGPEATLNGVTDVCDGRWHHAVATFDATAVRLYVDGALEATAALSGTMFSASAPLNIGGSGADGSTSAGAPHFGAIDEAFITSDVLAADQVRLLYAAKVTHSLGATPKSAQMSVRRRRRGGVLASGDFPTAPLRLYNFSAGSLADAGSQGVALTAFTSPTITVVAGPDGARDGALAIVPGGGRLGSSATGWPAASAPVSLGAWVATTDTDGLLIGYGSGGVEGRGIRIISGNPAVIDTNFTAIATGPPINDGAWHFVVAVYEPLSSTLAARLYVDGRLVASTATFPGSLGSSSAFAIANSVTASTNDLVSTLGSAFVLDYAIAAADIAKLYAIGSQALPPSPKDAGAHVEAFDATSLYLVCDTLETQYTIDMQVAA